MTGWKKIIKEVNNSDKINIPLFLKNIFSYSSKSILFKIRRMETHNKNNSKLLTMWQKKRIEKVFGCYISPNAKIGYGINLPHPSGVVIGTGVQIGEHCTIYQQVTLGGKKVGDMEQGNYPIVGNNVTIYAGAKILGKISIGDNAIVGANSVVTKNIEANSVYAGVPARRIDN